MGDSKIVAQKAGLIVPDDIIWNKEQLNGYCS